MALIFMDGFEAGDWATKWIAYNSNISTSTSTRLNYGQCLSFAGISSSGTVTTPSFTPATQIFVGLGVTAGSYNGGSFLRLLGDGGVTTHLQLQFNTASTLALFRGSTQIATATVPQVSFSGNIWIYLEVSATINATTGTCVVRANGTTVINFTGNTKNGGTNSSIDTVSLGGWSSHAFDDLYILDSTGAVNNTFLGDVRVQTLLPTGAGSSTQLTPTGSANNYANVNDTPDSASTYNASATSGQRDTYAIADLLAGTGTIYAVQDSIHAFKTDAGQAGIKPAIKSGATVYYDPTKNLSTSDIWYGTVRETDPATSAPWTVSAVNAAEFGGEVA